MSGQEFFGKSFDTIAKEIKQEQDVLEAAAAKKRALEEAAFRAAQQHADDMGVHLDALVANLSGNTNDIITTTLKEIAAFPDYKEIVSAYYTIPDFLNRLGYIDRIVYERTTSQGSFFMGVEGNRRFHSRLKEIGMPLLCPYFEIENANTLTHEDCTIDPETIMSSCGGRYDICVIFKDRTMRAARGEITLRMLPMAVEHPRNQECKVDLNDLHDWWHQEGEYE